MKTCPRCKESKPAGDWYRHPKGLSSYCKPCTGANHKEWIAKNREVDRAQVRARKNRMKFLVMSHYASGQPKCSCCGEVQFEFLTIDHIFGRKSVGHDKRIAGIKLWTLLKNSGFPTGYQVMCMNCNWGKFTNGVCPHQSKVGKAK